jgi:purine-binding chemotaxis protein CheW
MTIVNGTPERAIGRALRRSATLRRLVVFHLAAQSYGIAVEDVQEILPLAELSRPPACPALLAGFVNIGAEPVPVISLSRLFDFPEAPPGLYTPLLLLRAPRTRLALLVDRVSQIIALSDDAVSPMTNGHSVNNCVTGVTRWEESPILLLSAERLLLEKERKCLAELEAGERSRMALLQETIV